MRNYLEDIVDEDLKNRNKKPLPRTKLDEVLDLITTKPPIGLIVRHPIVSASLEFLILTALYERARSIQPDLFNPFMEERRILASAYALYIGAANAKDFREKKGNIFYIKPDKKGIYGLYEFLLNNPRLVALFASASAAFAKYAIEYNVFAELQNVKEFSDLSERAQARIVGVTFGAVASAGISTELALRGLRALRKIKKSARQKKASLEERAWNFIFEHPVALSAAATTAITYARYSVHSEKYSGKWFENIVNNTSVAFSFMLESLIAGTAVLAVTATAGSFLHSTALKENLLRAKRTYQKLRGKTKDAIQTQLKITRLPNSTEGRIEDLVELGNMQADAGDEEESLEAYRKSLRLFDKRSDEISYSELFRKSFRFDRLLRWFRKRKAARKNDDISLMFIGILNKDESALQKIKALAEKEPQNPVYRFIYGRALEILGYSESGRKQKELAVRDKIASGVGIRSIPGSKNIVIAFGDPLLKTEVIAKYVEEHGKAARERVLLEQARKELSEFENYGAPRYIGSADINDRRYQLIEYALGKTLSDKIIIEESVATHTSGLEKILFDISDVMALIHARIKVDLGEREHPEAVKEKLKSRGFDGQIVAQIYEDLQPLMEVTKEMPLVYQKDGHPDNWVISENGDIIAIDFEAGQNTRMPLDMAMLLSGTLLVSEQRKRDMLMFYARRFEKYSGTKLPRENKIYLAYLNSVVVAALERYTFTSGNAKLNLLSNAQSAIEIIRENFPADYIRHRHNYDRLYENLKHTLNI